MESAMLEISKMLEKNQEAFQRLMDGQTYMEKQLKDVKEDWRDEMAEKEMTDRALKEVDSKNTRAIG